MVPPAIPHEEPLVVAGCTEGLVVQLQRGEDAVGRASRVADARPPGAVASAPRCIEVAARLDHEVANAMRPKHRGGAVHRKSLPDATEMDAHAAAAEQDRACLRVDVHGAVIDQWQQRADITRPWHLVVLVVIELPQTRECPERDIELSGGPLADLPGRLQHLDHFAGDDDWRTPRGGIDS